jgi:hypothetical protein
MTTSSIGTSSRDFSTVTAWVTYLDALTFTQDEIGECYNDAQFVEKCDFVSGITNGSNKVILTAAAGQSFVDHADKLTNPLRYDQSKGVGFLHSTSSGSGIGAAISNFEVRRVQLRVTRDFGGGLALGNASTTVMTAEQCLVFMDNTNGASGINMQATSAGTIKNCVVIHDTTATGTGVIGIFTDRNGAKTIQNCTLIRTRSAGSTIGLSNANGTPTVTNCAVFGFSDANAHTTTAHTGSHNASDLTFSFGSSNQESLTFANQFESITTGSVDARLKTGNGLQGLGTATGTPTTDIVGTTRANPPAIGAWDAGGVGGGNVVIAACMV